jgi:hypothetical protein
MIKRFNKFISENYVGVNQAMTPMRKRKYATALEMANRGVDMENIRLATGWFMGEFDGKWRYEHNTSIIRFKKLPVYAEAAGIINIHVDDANDGETYRCIEISLGDLLENTSLFKEYPFLKSMPVKLWQHIDPKRGGYYSPKKRYIAVFGVMNRLMLLDRLNTQFKEESNNPAKTAEIQAEIKECKKNLIVYDDRLKAILLHEIQHAIQTEEGFANGGSPEMFEPKIWDNQEELIKRRHTVFMEKHPEMKKAWDKMQSLNIDPTEWSQHPDVVAYYKLEDETGFTDLKKSIRQFIDPKRTLLSREEQYRMLAGEIEARDVTHRISMEKEPKFVVYQLLGGMNLDPEGNSLATFSTEKEARAFIEKHPEKETLRWMELASRKNTKPNSSEFYDKDKVIRKFTDKDGNEI